MIIRPSFLCQSLVSGWSDRAGMDPITHAVLGASCSQVLLHKYDKHNAWLVGGLAAMAPDLDVFIRSADNPMLSLLFHRQFTHSLLFIPVGALIVSLVLLLFKRFRPHWQYTFLAALIGYSTHGLLDACTSYGTLLFWPFSNRRISWDIVSIIDPFVTIPLCLGLVGAIVFKKRRAIIIAFLFVGAFFLFNIEQHHKAITEIDRELTTLRIKPAKVRVFPKLGSSIQWRGIALDNQQLYIIDVSIPLFKKPNTQLIKIYPHFTARDLPEYVKKSPTLFNDFTLFNWFSDGFLFEVKRDPLLLSDGRFLVDEHAELPLWSIQFLSTQKHVNKILSLPIGTNK